MLNSCKAVPAIAVCVCVLMAMGTLLVWVSVFVCLCCLGRECWKDLVPHEQHGLDCEQEAEAQDMLLHDP